jgi:hypothetical protein
MKSEQNRANGPGEKQQKKKYRTAFNIARFANLKRPLKCSRKRDGCSMLYMRRDDEAGYWLLAIGYWLGSYESLNL